MVSKESLKLKQLQFTELAQGALAAANSIIIGKLAL